MPPKSYKVKITANGTDINYNQDTGLAFILGERTYEPVRATMEHLGAEVKWSKEENIVEVIYNGKTVKFLIGEDRYFVNEEENILDAAPFISPADGRVYLPLRFLAETLGFQVKVDMMEDMIHIGLENAQSAENRSEENS
ncbi:copper amine oxidase N-terminal domain-containing protein [Thermoanaerobacter sp. CM-CNRG TB177]|jgi:hypothetical protein|uniref:copper amine oxidase N-terminal domain-containing protein n=1 Tax=Thermoanaerobacter sp. CM-CNRG TB177 TaxID=2800659 RepID=UPI001BDEB6C0|nr:copper amine oxidase N-terminal domain-containing protein [Thermoanaerobacter sp. CM-CNRG TB177]MBT1279463.1 copper amine oxidase N-terminal domain-containing protein [Thermoanaerobacter sp. CM-CNRG TB177]